MDIGVAVAFSHLTPVDLIVGTARRIEAAGFTSMWLPEHVVFFGDYDSSYPYADDGKLPGDPEGILDPFAALTFVAAHTSTLRLGTGVCLVPQRQPIYTAKMVADLDYLSGGRFDFGVGVGWLEEEFDALNADFGARGARCDEYLEVMKALWTQSPAAYQGETVSFANVHFNPKPVQRPHPPVLVGGHSGPALRRVAAHGDGWYGYDLDPDEFTSCLARLDDEMAAAGRSRDDLLLYVSPGRRRSDPEMIDRYAEAGADQVIVPLFARDLDELDRRIERVRAGTGMDA